MRKIGALGIALVLLISGIGLLGASIAGDKPEEKDMRGNPTKYITATGFDPYGYNYIAHMFSWQKTAKKEVNWAFGSHPEGKY